jgi:uncharacterized membrane protein
MLFFKDFYPLSFSPKGERFLTPSPLGEGWEGGNLLKKMTSIYILIICYLYCEELHRRQAEE